MNEGEKMLLVFVIAVVVLGLLIIGPIFSIWSLNLVFGLEIPINFKTWCAITWLMTLLNGIRFNTNTKSD